MVKRSELLARVLVTFVFAYGISIGATFNGIVAPQFRFLDLGILTGLVICWLLIRWRRSWGWFQTPLDRVFLLWTLAFAVSLAANVESWRRIAIGLWYLGAYVGLWYLLTDMIANSGLRRETLVEGLLVSGTVVLIFGYVQIQSWVTNWLPLIMSGQAAPELPRPVSTFGNANALGGFLVVLIPFGALQVVDGRSRFVRVVMGLYTLLALGLLFLTYSRGAWIGAGIGLAAFGLLVLADRQLLSRERLRDWWNGRRAAAKTVVIAVSIVVVIALVVITIILARSFTEAGRSAELRTTIWEAALTLFAEKPLTGHGLFTFGRGLTQLQSVPPTNSHSHAHNAPLHLAAELGVLGLAALCITLWLIIAAIRRHWRTTSGRERILLAGAVGAVAGFAAHQLTDIPAMMPAIALVGLVALALALTPPKSSLLAAGLAKRGRVVAVVPLWGMLLVSGIITSGWYSQYIEALRYGSSSGDYLGAAAQIEAVAASDPALALRYKEQGLFYGMAAAQGDTQAAQLGITAFAQFIMLEPEYAIVWANKAALHWQLGEQGAALEAMQQAVTRAPQAWQLRINLMQYYEAMGDSETAQTVFEEVLRQNPDASLYPEVELLTAGWPVSGETVQLSIPAQVAMALENGETGAALALWNSYGLPGSTSDFVLSVLIALAEGDRDRAAGLIDSAGHVIAGREDQAWAHLGRARLAQFDGDEMLAGDELARAQAALERGLMDEDFRYGLSLAYAQFLSLGIARQFLPQVYYPVDSPVLLYLLDRSD